MMKLSNDYTKLYAEWDHDKNDLIENINNGTKIWWICSNEPHHEWQATIANRTLHGSGCPICSGNIVCKCGCNSLQNLNPELCKEWHPKNINGPNLYRPNSKFKVWWQCKKDPHHEWLDTIAHRNTEKRGCSICSNYIICKCGCNSLEGKAPDLAKQWDKIKNKKTAREIPYASNMNAWWRCSKDPHHSWKASICNRYRLKSNCPICVNMKVCECGCNSFSKRFPEIAKE
jgi:hypothetical protein